MSGFVFVFSLFLLVRFRAPLRPPSSLDSALTFHLSTTRFRKGTVFYGGYLAAILLGLWRACVGIQSGSAASNVKIVLQFMSPRMESARLFCCSTNWHEWSALASYLFCLHSALTCALNYVPPKNTKNGFEIVLTHVVLT